MIVLRFGIELEWQKLQNLKIWGWVGYALILTTCKHWFRDNIWMHIELKAKETY